jgi:hypothetical protein
MDMGKVKAKAKPKLVKAENGGKNGSVSLAPGIVLMDLDVSVWGAKAPLTPGDLGLEASSVPDDFYLGHRALIDKEIMRQARTREGRGRRILEKYGFAFPIGQTRAVPMAVIPSVEAELAEERKQFEAWVSQFVGTDYPALRDMYIKKHGEEVRKFFPTPEELRSRFGYEWVAIQVSVPTGNDENAAKVRARIETWVDDIAKALRAAATDTFTKIAGRLDNLHVAPSLCDRDLERLRNVVARLRSLNFLDDQAVETNLLSAKKLLDGLTAGEVRKDEAVAAQMKKALTSIVDGINAVSVDEVTAAYKRKLRI